MKRYWIVGLLIILLGGVSNTILWNISSLFKISNTFHFRDSFGILLFSIYYSAIPVLLSLLLIGFVEKSKDNRFIWWVHLLPLSMFLFFTPRGYYGAVSLFFYYLIGSVTYYLLIHKPRKSASINK